MGTGCSWACGAGAAAGLQQDTALRGKNTAPRVLAQHAVAASCSAASLIPAGMAMIPVGTVAVPARKATVPKGIETAPAGTAVAPVGMAAIPAGMAMIPVGTVAVPARKATVPKGMKTAPAGMMAAPVGMAAAPEGTAATPAGMEAVPPFRTAPVEVRPATTLRIVECTAGTAEERPPPLEEEASLPGKRTGPPAKRGGLTSAVPKLRGPTDAGVSNPAGLSSAQLPARQQGEHR
jgi:hypothetical protein